MKTFIYITFGALLATVTTLPIVAQTITDINTNQHMVSMSENDLSNLITTLKKYKKTKSVLTANTPKIENDPSNNTNFEVVYLQNRVMQLEQLLAQSRITQNGSSNQQNSLNNHTDRYVQNKLDELTRLLQQMETKNSQAPIIVTTPSAQHSREVIVQPNTVSKTPNTDKDTSIKQKIDSLYKVIAANKTPEAKNYSNDFDALQNKLVELQNELAVKKATPTNYETLKAKYANYDQKIYFTNNSKALNTSANQIIDDVVQILEANNNVDVIVKGFASDQGNPIYNEKLSLQRTEEVKRNLMIKGIHPTRVLTQYHGIDYKSPDAISARRVEISLLVRK